MSTKSIILLDFDNIFLGLWKLDRDLAVRFGETPLEWLSLLADRHLTLETRRWLVARCYLNPGGWVESPAEQSGRLYLWKFRPALVRAGFEVIDCPGLTRAGKNAADIRIVIDALDLLNAPCRYDEFVIASGDADFAPLVHRLRANDRRITIMSPGHTASAYTSLADRIVGFDALDALIRVEQASPTLPSRAAAPEGAADEARFRDYIRDRFVSSITPLNMTSLAHDVARAFPGAREGGYFGAGSFSGAIARLGLPNLRLSQHFVWDEERHAPPTGSDADAASDFPAEVAQLQQSLDLPRLPQSVWPEVFDVLARYAAQHDFNLTEATRWSRDTLADEGRNVSRPAIGYVVRGLQFSGASLDRIPAPSAAEIGFSFVDQLLERASRIGIDVTPEGEVLLADWFGVELEAGD